MKTAVHGAALMIVLMCATIAIVNRVDIDTAPGAEIDPAILEMLRDEYQAALQGANEGSTAAGRQMQARMESFIQKHSAAARNAVPDLMNDLFSIRGCVRLCWLMAGDKVKGTDLAEQRIAAALQTHVMEHLQACGAELRFSLAQLQDALEATRTAMKIRLADATQAAGYGYDDVTREALASFTIGMDAVFASGPGIAIPTLASSVGLAVSATLAKNTYGRAKKVLEAVIKRFFATKPTAATLALADGPFPFGDLLALTLEIGGTVVAAHELYRAQIALKGQVGGLLTESIDRFENEMRLGAKRQVAKMVEAYEIENKKTVQRLLRNMQTGRKMP